MGKDVSHRAVSLHAPANFEIRVPGKLDTTWADHVGAAAISYTEDVAEGPLRPAGKQKAPRRLTRGLDS